MTITLLRRWIYGVGWNLSSLIAVSSVQLVSYVHNPMVVVPRDGAENIVGQFKLRPNATHNVGEQTY
jgi:hypothetical protein